MAEWPDTRETSAARHDLGPVLLSTALLLRALVGLQLAIWLPPDQTFTRAARASLPFLGLVAAPVTISLVMPVPLALGGALYGIIAAVVQRRFAVRPTPEPPTAHPR